MKDFNVLKSRWGDHEFSLLDIQNGFGHFEVSICRYTRYKNDGCNEWRDLFWPLLQVCFFSHHSSILADVFLFGRLFPIRRKGRSWPDDLPF